MTAPRDGQAAHPGVQAAAWRRLWELLLTPHASQPFVQPPTDDPSSPNDRTEVVADKAV